MRRSASWLTGLLTLFVGVAAAGVAAIDVSGPTTSWSPVSFGIDGSIYPDPAGDQQTGSSEADIIGNKANPCFYTAFDSQNSLWGFRIRLAEEKMPPGYGECAFVGLDLGYKGKVDLFLGIDNTGAGGRLGIWRAGPGENISPSTTTIVQTPLFTYAETAVNYSWITVSKDSDPTATTYDLDGGGAVDRFLSFVVSFKDVSQAATVLGLDPLASDTVLGYVVATATQPNSLNQDITGVNGGTDSGTSWKTLGGVSAPSTPDPLAVPEPRALALALAGLGVAAGMRLSRSSRPAHRPRR